MQATFDAESAGAPGTDDEIFCESDCEGEVFESSPSLRSSGSASGSEILQTSGDEELPPIQPQKRGRYVASLTFLGQRVCKVAFQRLLGVGNSSVDKIRKGERAFTNERREPLQKHPTFGFTLRGRPSNSGRTW